MPLPTLLVPGNLQGAPSDVIALDDISGWIKRKLGVKHATSHSRIMVIMSETGSGKSTALTVELLRFVRPKKMLVTEKLTDPGVICTQPRVLTAKSTAEDICVGNSPFNTDCIIGETVGYRTEELSNIPKQKGCVYATAGVLSAQLRTLPDESIMKLYKFIQIDEAHERQLECDLMLLLLRSFYRRNAGNPDLPFLLLTSATFDPKKYADYFGVGDDNIWRVTGSTFSKQEYWLSEPTKNIIEESARIAHKITVDNPDDPPEKADILIFMPGAAEMKNVKYLLEQNKDTNYIVLTIDGISVKAESPEATMMKMKVKDLPLNKFGIQIKRRIVLSTVVAETGLTIETLKYVIDNGWNRGTEIYPLFNLSGLVTLPAPKSRIKQRRGRVGRKFNGVCYYLYTKETHEALETQQLPDVITAGVGNNLLAIMIAQQQRKNDAKTGDLPEFSINDMAEDLLDMPAPEDLMSNIELLTNFGFISENAPLPDGKNVGFGVTEIGHVAAKFGRTPIRGIRMIFAAYTRKVSILDVVSAAVSLDLRSSPYENMRNPKLREQKFELDEFVAKAKIIGNHNGINNDFAEIALIFDQFSTILADTPKNVHSWCEKYNLNYLALIELTKLRDYTIEEMIQVGLDPFVNDHLHLSEVSLKDFPDILDEFTSCLTTGLSIDNLSLNEETKEYRTKKGLVVDVSKKIRKNEYYPRYLLTNKLDVEIQKSKEKSKVQEVLINSERIYNVKTGGFVCAIPGKTKIDIAFSSVPIEKRKLIQTDKVGLFSITMGRQSHEIADMMLELKGISKKSTITDMTACIGADTLTFHEYFEHVNSIELDKSRFGMLNNNIKVYGAKNIKTFNGDSMEIIKTLKQDIIYIDPPWGGPDYKKDDKTPAYLGEKLIQDVVYDLEKLAKHVVLKLPMNIDAGPIFKRLTPISKVWFSQKKVKNMKIIFISFGEKHENMAIKTSRPPLHQYLQKKNSRPIEKK